MIDQSEPPREAVRVFPPASALSVLPMTCATFVTPSVPVAVPVSRLTATARVAAE